MLLLSVHPISPRLVKIHWRLFSSPPRPPFFRLWLMQSRLASCWLPACLPACCRCCCCAANSLRTDPTEDDERSRGRRLASDVQEADNSSRQLSAGLGSRARLLGSSSAGKGFCCPREPIPFNGLFFVFLRVRCFSYFGVDDLDTNRHCRDRAVRWWWQGPVLSFVLEKQMGQETHFEL